MKKILTGLALLAALTVGTLSTASMNPVQAQTQTTADEVKTVVLNPETAIGNVVENLKAHFTQIQALGTGDKFILIGAMTSDQQPFLVILYAGTAPGSVGRITMIKLPPNGPKTTST